VKKRYLCNGDKLSGISVSPKGFFTSNYLSLRGRARMMAEMAISRGKGEEESVFGFTSHRFGSISRGIINAKKRSAPGRHLYFWKDGMQTIPQRMAARLGSRLILGWCRLLPRSWARLFGDICRTC